MNFNFFIASFIIHILFISANAQIRNPGPHSHNDYLQKKPLQTALEAGFESIEIDIYLHNGQLKVSHLPFALDSKPELEALYFAPLKQRIDQNGGFVYQANESLILMIDMKGNAREAYPELRKLLEKYEPYLTVYYPDSVKKGALQICLSGGRPADLVQSENKRFVTLDGSISDTTSAMSPLLLQRLSDPYSRHFSWRGKGKMPEDQKLKLRKLVASAHRHGRQIRFYAAGNRTKLWKELYEAGVDWINVDKIALYKKQKFGKN